MSNSIDYKKTLNEIQKIIHSELKQIGFIKHGRTHNCEVQKGIIQVINFQAGQFPIGSNYVIPGLRENLYGKFTINLGVYVESVAIKLNSKPSKVIIHEYDCEMRTRLNNLIVKKDEWYSIDNNYLELTNRIISDLKSEGKQWFNKFNTHEKIVSELRNNAQPQFSSRPKLIAALIRLDFNKTEATLLFNDYLNSIPEDKPHKKWVFELAQRLNIG